MIENIENDDENKIVCIYSKYDKFIVERLVGSVKAIEMVKEYCTNVSFIIWEGLKMLFIIFMIELMFSCYENSIEY